MPGKRPRCEDCGIIHPWSPTGFPVQHRPADGTEKQAKSHKRDSRHVYERGIDHQKLRRLDREAFPVMTAHPGPIRPELQTDAQLLQLVRDCLKADRYDWAANARPDQREPEAYEVWLLLGGRGMGKTRTGSETVRDWVTVQGMKRVAVIAKGSRELRDVCFESKDAGLLACIPPELILNYRKGLGDTYLELKNGAKIIGYSAEAPDAIRGQAFDAIWGDEFAAWPKHLAQDMYDQAWFTLRETQNPRMVLTTTPKRVPHLMDLLEREGVDAEVRIVVTKGKTTDNTALSKKALAALYARYAGTHLGRQELDGELLNDVEGALWVPPMVEAARWFEHTELPKFHKVIVGVDPSGSATGDATGIVVLGYTLDRRIFVLGCYSTKGLPAQRYGAVCRATTKHRAQGNRVEILVEYNFGGDNAIFAIQQQWKHMIQAGEIEGACPLVKKSTLKGDKAVKASPFAALYEQQMNIGIERVFHAWPTPLNGIDKLENELLSWAVTDKASPNSLDAAVIAGRRAMLELGLEAVISTASTTRRIEDGYRPDR